MAANSLPKKKVLMVGPRTWLPSPTEHTLSIRIFRKQSSCHMLAPHPDADTHARARACARTHAHAQSGTRYVCMQDTWAHLPQTATMHRKKEQGIVTSRGEEGEGRCCSHLGMFYSIRYHHSLEYL